MPERAHLFLVPGFFGFANLGEFRYFAHVRAFLAAHWAERGIDVHIHDVPTRPTASLTWRAAFLAERIAALAPHGPVHLVGHSSGGLDARLLMMPSARLPTTADLDEVRARVRSVVTVATPHLGTPVATFFCTLYGQQLLRVLSLAALAVIRRGRVPRAAMVAMAGALAARTNAGSSILGHLYRDLLEEFDEERRLALDTFLSDVNSDPRLMVQLRPEGLELLNAVGRVPDHVRCGSVVVAARPPDRGAVRDAGFSATQQAGQAVYAQLHRLASGALADAPPLTPEQHAALGRVGRVLLDPTANDGMVPTRSQVWRTVVAAAQADHLDIIGHFKGSELQPPHYDWLHTGSAFRRPAFEQVWGAVADFLALDARLG